MIIFYIIFDYFYYCYRLKEWYRLSLDKRKVKLNIDEQYLLSVYYLFFSFVEIIGIFFFSYILGFCGKNLIFYSGKDYEIFSFIYGYFLIFFW